MQHKVNVFGNQNLREIVDKALEEHELSPDISINDQYVEVSTGLRDGSSYSSVFELLFNPEDGYLNSLGADLGFRLRKSRSYTAGWGTDYSTVKTAELGLKEIEHMQNKSVEESFAEGYSPERFKELYEEVVEAQI